jgi:hypothetical protein
MYQKHGNRGLWTISIAFVERSPDIEVSDNVDDDPDPRHLGGSLVAQWAFQSMRGPLRSEA